MPTERRSRHYNNGHENMECSSIYYSRFMEFVNVGLCTRHMTEVSSRRMQREGLLKRFDQIFIFRHKLNGYKTIVI